MSSSSTTCRHRPSVLQWHPVASLRIVVDTHDGSAELHISDADGAGSSRPTLDRVERMRGVRANGRNLNTVDRMLALVDP